jgi:predicted dehydrogenase
MKEGQVSRREFMRGAAAAGAAFGAFTILGTTAKGQGKALKVALIGCGGRGTGALQQHVDAAKILNDQLNLGVEVKVVATCDYFAGKAKDAGKKHGVPEDRCFGGPNGYKKVCEGDADIVLLGETPAFRPPHFAAAIKAGKHVFMEKPVAVDAPGCRLVIEAGEEAKKKGLLVVAGTQRRHEEGYNRQAALIKEGARGKVLAGRVGWCGGGWNEKPVGELSPDRLVSSWYFWVQMSGDHIVEQHVHNLDVANWFVGSHPIACMAFGGRARRRAGNIFDFFSGDVEYPGGVHIHSMCRQVNKCWEWVSEDFVYEKQPPPGFKLSDPLPYSEIPQKTPDGKWFGGHQQEHVNMLYYLAKGKELNEARSVAESTAVAVMIRDSAYTGERIEWKAMMEDPKLKPELYNLKLRPSWEDYEQGTVELPKEGDFPIPGKA